MSDQKRIAYDLAQKVDERMDRLMSCTGWTEIVIPEVKGRRDKAQALINDPQSDQRTTDLNRGILQTCDEILNLVEEKKKAAASNMAANLSPTTG